MVTGNINPADCTTLEFPVSPAGILSPGGGWLLLFSDESKQKSNALFIYSFYSPEDLFLNNSCYNSVVSL